MSFSLFTKIPNLLNVIKVIPTKTAGRVNGLMMYIMNYKSHIPTPLMMYSLAHCESKTDINIDNDVSNLTVIQFRERPMTHEHLIQQACSASVNSATQLLTQTLVAILDTANLYREAMNELLSLLDESIQRTLHDDLVQSDLTDSLVVARAKVAELNKSFLELTSLMESVEKLVRSTAEAAFIAGADTLCNTMSDRLQSALMEITNNKGKNKELEDECLKLQQSLVYETVERERKKKSKLKKLEKV